MNSLKDALAIAPMDLCTLPHKSPSRAWWRYGWAYGFIMRNENDALAPVREQRFRVALMMGYQMGVRARAEMAAARANG